MQINLPFPFSLSNSSRRLGIVHFSINAFDEVTNEKPLTAKAMAFKNAFDKNFKLIKVAPIDQVLQAYATICTSPMFADIDHLNVNEQPINPYTFDTPLNGITLPAYRINITFEEIKHAFGHTTPKFSFSVTRYKDMSFEDWNTFDY